MLPSEELNSALISSGFGKFNVFVLLIAIPGSWAIMFATTTISFIVGRAECDLDLSLGDIGTLNSMPYIGMLIFTIPWSILSDNIGRQKIAVISYILDAIIVILCSFSQTKYELIILKFLNGATICGAFSALMTYVSEVHTGLMRTRALFFIGMCLTIAPLLLPALAAAIVPAKWNFKYGEFRYHPWSLFLLISALPSLICGLSFIFMPESPKYDAAKNNSDRALITLQKIFQMNTGKPIEEYSVKTLGSESVNVQLTFKQRFEEGWSKFKELFKKNYILLALNIFIIEFCILMCQNSFRLWLPKLFETIKQFKDGGKIANSLCEVLNMVQTTSKTKQKGSCQDNISWDSYINNFYVAIASILGFILSAVLVEVTNPKVVFSGSLGISLLFSMALTAATNEESIVGIIAVYLAAENIASTSVFNVCLHFFPTNLRNTVLGFGMTIGRLGSFIGNKIFPYILMYSCIFFFVWIGFLGTVAFVFTLFIPNPTAAAHH